jgi:hypothetical protein
MLAKEVRINNLELRKHLDICFNTDDNQETLCQDTGRHKKRILLGHLDS